MALTLAALALVLVAWSAGWAAVGHAFADFHPGWIALIVIAQGAALGAYAIAYRTVALACDGPPMSFALSVHAVVTGFGAFAVGGGFAVDQRVMDAAGGTPERALTRVLGLGALEYAVLAPAACVAAIDRLAVGDHSVQAAVLWPWALAVPAGFAVGLWAATPERLGRLQARPVQAMVGAVAVLRGLAVRPLHHAGAWLGMALYWVAEIASLYGALRLFGAHLGVATTILGYATGYALTRRTLPLGGAGITEALLSIALIWVGLPLARAVPPVLAYRVVNFLLPLAPAMRAHRTTVGPMLDESEAGRIRSRSSSEAA